MTDNPRSFCRQKKWLLFSLGFLGIIFGFFGWTLDHKEQLPILVDLLCPSYARASQAYAAMLDPNAQVCRGDTGFEEIESLLIFDGTTPTDVQCIDASLDTSFRLRPGYMPGPAVSITVTFTTGELGIISNQSDLSLVLQRRFIRTPIWNWGWILVVIGLAFAFGMQLVELLC